MTDTVVIIGAGPAGIASAIQLRRQGMDFTLFEAERVGGLLWNADLVENYPGFKDPINGFELMFNMQKQAEHFGTEIKNETVASVNFKNGGPQEVTLTSGETLTAKAVIIATGASPRWLGLESEQWTASIYVNNITDEDSALQIQDFPLFDGSKGYSVAGNAINQNAFQILPRRSLYTAWAKVLGREYRELVSEIEKGHRTDIDPYGALSPAEFFAVVTECFFEQPAALRRKHPELYQQLSLFYHPDPR